MKTQKIYLQDRSSTTFKKEIWNFPVSKDMDTSSFSRDELIKHNLRYSYWLAARYCPQHIPLSEFIGESNLGLVEEANKADTPGRKKSFTHLARIRIAGKLNQLRWSQASPLSVSRDFRKYHKRVSKTVDQLKRQFETENICSLDVYSQLDGLQTSDFFDIINPFFGIVSIDDEGSFQGDIPETDSRIEVVDRYHDIKENLLVILHRTLTDLEFVVVTEAFGLLRTKAKTIAEISGILGVSLKQVYTNYNSAISKLRNREVQDMLVSIQNMDISRYTNFESINQVFEKRYAETLQKSYSTTETKSLKSFEEHEILWLQNNYKKVSLNDCLNYINSRRDDKRQISRDHFRRLVSILGLTSSKSWTIEEEELIRKHYGRIPDVELAALLSNQSLTGKTFTTVMIAHKASRMKITKKDIA